ncbi:unnamed protein product [Ranitomeya imitator]|uniref:Helix-turn-helix domain-containing protein n=1 Tax=Ranitomeya imitator TaxID=111125 RepID=A0ABN9L149_9NEOB|nr:unnamed protein product [Ranitomeya imitator]
MIDEAFYSGTIDSKLAKYLKVEHPLVPILYTLPKIHRDLQRPPGRPIVSGRGSLFNKISFFLDRLFRKFAVSAPSYERDMSDFIKSLEAVQVVDSTWLVSFDVTSLYTSIKHARGLSAVGVTLAGSDMALVCARFALAQLEFILRRTFFLFSDGYYLQHLGTSMGSNVAPTYANIYMAVLEGDETIHTDLFVKITDRNNLLHFSSEHLRKMVESLPWSQLLRVRRIVSCEILIDERLEEMCQKFMLRGYPKADLVSFKKLALEKNGMTC